MNNFITRLRTAIFFVAVMVLGTLWNVYSYAVLMSVILIFCLNEYYNMLNYTREQNRISMSYKVIAISFSILLFLTSCIVIKEVVHPFIYSFFVLIIYGYFILELFADSSRPLDNVAQNVIGIIYIVLPFVILNYVSIVDGAYEPRLVLGILFLVWINDAGAYVFGSLFGKHKFLPRISPNKTIEGLGGGILGCMTVAYLQYLIFGIFSLVDWMIIAVIVSIFATIGDLIVSMFKRSLNIKDTGEFFPGHGGFLDRFDAFIYAIPFVAVYIFYLRHLAG